MALQVPLDPALGLGDDPQADAVAQAPGQRVQGDGPAKVNSAPR
jgi:hypothetical protein